MSQSSESIIEVANQERDLSHLWQIIGASKATSNIARSLGAQSVRAMQVVRDKKLFQAAGHTKFDSFLDKHPESPMSHDAFLRREKLLEAEGDIAFDLLNSLNVPLSQRKMLAGQVEVEGNTIKIGEIECELNDETRIIEVISNLHSKNLELQRTNERKDKKLAQGEKDFENLKRRAISINPDGTETGQALLTAAGAMTRLKEILAAASDDEKKALSESVFDFLRTAQLECSVALGVLSKDELPASDDENEDLDLEDGPAAARN